MAVGSLGKKEEKDFLYDAENTPKAIIMDSLRTPSPCYLFQSMVTILSAEFDNIHYNH